MRVVKATPKEMAVKNHFSRVVERCSAGGGRLGLEGLRLVVIGGLFRLFRTRWFKGEHIVLVHPGELLDQHRRRLLVRDSESLQRAGHGKEDEARGHEHADIDVQLADKREPQCRFSPRRFGFRQQKSPGAARE